MSSRCTCLSSSVSKVMLYQPLLRLDEETTDTMMTDKLLHPLVKGVEVESGRPEQRLERAARAEGQSASAEESR